MFLVSSFGFLYLYYILCKNKEMCGLSFKKMIEVVYFLLFIFLFCVEYDLFVCKSLFDVVCFFRRKFF